MPDLPFILVVDDEPSVRRVIRAFLERNGNRVVEAQNGDDALNLFRQERSQIQLVVSDVRMMGMDGNELARRIHQIHPSQRILFITAYPGDVEDPVRRRDTIAKPFNGVDLVGRVNSLTSLPGCSPGA